MVRVRLLGNSEEKKQRMRPRKGEKEERRKSEIEGE